ncbi:AAA family ATPase [[Mycobacterium] kokjensenii]|uniref:AAA family ATPase n=1 Tax=[Mycobacterium] kokjensenii TaxID=3064287 RepID=A0ABM9L8E2_9MYCO|nr:LuxR family transcriptional regulator [Mycolicibacter sp. MU0083]CAJ1494497.1 AAA family ATPase [Mycolicibacter sp. MU0083]
MVARAAESAALRAFLKRAESEPASLLVEGEAGIGKSTLLWEAAETADERGFHVLSAVGAPTEVRYAYAAVADLLGGVDTDVLAQLPPEQRAVLERVQLGGGEGPGSDERMVAIAFLAVTHRMSSAAPVLLCIDDAQWLDMSSRMVVDYIERRLVGRVGMLLTARTGAVGTVDPAGQNPLRSESIERLRIAPLTLGGVHTLISTRLGYTLPRPSIARIHEISGGNPFFALEMARHIDGIPGRYVTGLPNALASLVSHHLRGCDDEVSAVLLAAACATLPSVERVSVVTGMSPDRVVELVESEQASAVVKLDRGRIRFNHPLFATGVYSLTRPSDRRRMHRRLAETVHEAELTARHLALADTSAGPEVLRALDDAAVVTQLRGAPAVAAELLELAIGLGGDTPHRRMSAAENHFRSGSIELARGHLQSIADGSSSPKELRCAALIGLGAICGYDMSLVGAAELLSEAIDQSVDNPVLQLQARLLLIPLMRVLGDLSEAVRLADVAVAQAEQLGAAGLRSQALTIRSLVRFCHGLGGDSDGLQTALELEDRSEAPAALYRASAFEPVIRFWSGEIEQAQGPLQTVHRQLLADATETDILWITDHVATLELWSGHYAQAKTIADEAVQRAEQLGADLALVCAWYRQAEVAAYIGSVESARAVAGVVIEKSSAGGNVMHTKLATAILGFLEVSLGDYAAALDVLAPLLMSFDPEHECEIVAGGFLPDAMEALTALGRLDEAERLIAAVESSGSRLDRPWMLAVGARGRGHWLAAQGNLEAAEEAALAALIHHRRLPMPFETARTRLLLGQVQRRRRRRTAAQATLGEALTTFETLGSPLWAKRARAELDRMTSVGPAAGLTAAELRIAERAAEGMPNKQIAVELFIALKTVESTLSKVYRKLGIRSRAGLFAALNPDEIGARP